MDQMIKNILVLLVKNRELVSRILSYWEPAELEKGVLTLHQDLINHELKPLLLEQFHQNLKDLRISFESGAIDLDLELIQKQVGLVQARFRLTILEFRWIEASHTILINYQEDVSSKDGLLGKMILAAAGFSRKNFVQMGIEKMDLLGVKASRDVVELNLDQIPETARLPLDRVSLRYLDCQQGKLRFSFTVLG